MPLDFSGSHWPVWMKMFGFNPRCILLTIPRPRDTRQSRNDGNIHAELWFKSSTAYLVYNLWKLGNSYFEWRFPTKRHRLLNRKSSIYFRIPYSFFVKKSPCLSKWLVPWLRKVIGNSSKGLGELVVPFVLAGGWTTLPDYMNMISATHIAISHHSRNVCLLTWIYIVYRCFFY